MTNTAGVNDFILTSISQLTDPIFYQNAFKNPWKERNKRLLERHLLFRLKYYANFDRECFFNRARESHIPDKHTGEIFKRWQRRDVLIEDHGLFNINEGREFQHILQSIEPSSKTLSYQTTPFKIWY